MVAGDTVWVSGEIPRVTEWEGGLLGGVRWNEDKRDWVNEEVSPYITFTLLLIRLHTISLNSTSWTSDMLVLMLSEKVSSYSARQSYRSERNP